MAAKDGQFTAFEFHGPLEIGEPCRLLASNEKLITCPPRVPAERFGAGQRLRGHLKSDALQEPARHRLSLSRRCFVVAGLFRCVGRRRSDHQVVCRR
jgi:hypothetical protein